MTNEDELNILIHKINLKEEELSKLRNQLALLTIKEIKFLKEKHGKTE